MLNKVAENIWEIARPIGYKVVDPSTRMTIVRLSDGTLWVHSPVKLEPQLKGVVDAIGPVAFIVAPNQYHHLFVTPWLEAYPGAKLACVSSPLKKRKDLSAQILLDQTTSYPWSHDLDTSVIRGSYLFTEANFFHKSSKTLILTDFAFNIPPQKSFLFDSILKVWGVFNQFKPSRLLRLFCRDHAAVRSGLAKMKEWDFQRIIVAHGLIIETNARSRFAEAFSWAITK